MNLSGPSVVVTGGARGVGRGIARAFLERGAWVTVCSLHEETLAAGVADLAASGRVTGVVAGASTVSGCQLLMEHAREQRGPIGAVVANAGLYRPTPPGSTTEEDWDRIVAVNLRSAFLSLQAALPDLRESRGSAVFISSVNGVVGRRDSASAYAAAKGGLVALARHLALELAPEVRVNCVAPGSVETERTLTHPPELLAKIAAGVPLERLATMPEVAAAVVGLVENDYMTGALVSVDGGLAAGHRDAKVRPTP